MMGYLYFSIGPVQSFIAKGRKTQDLWSSSFLLSYLSGCAMHEVLQQGGTIISPNISNDPIIEFLQGESTTPLRIGSLPNQFEAEVKGNTFDIATAARDRVIREWKIIAVTVWNNHVDTISKLGVDTKELFHNQIEAFWDINFIIGSKNDSISILKNWRQYTIPDQEGDKCTIMGDWQELSGFTRTTNRADQDKFWERLRRDLPSGLLRESERICAIALVKRLFPLVAERLGIPIAKLQIPSTSYMATIPWLSSLTASEISNFRPFVEKVQSDYASYVRQKLGKQFPSFTNDGSGLFDIEADLFYTNYLQYKKYDDLLELRKNTTDTSPSRYYAILVMDGDNIGSLKHHLEMEGNTEQLSSTLGIFSTQVNSIVCNFDGFLIYSGGDDVLAFLPVPTVIACAVELSIKFTTMVKNNLGEQATMSAGIVILPQTDPLVSGLEHVQEVLKELAKDGNGRGSVAINILDGGSIKASYITSWDHLISNDGNKINLLIEKGRQLSQSFIYKSRAMISRLSGVSAWHAGLRINWSDLPNLNKLLTAEALKAQNGNRGDYEEGIKLLVDLLHVKYGPGKITEQEHYLMIDFLILYALLRKEVLV